ncbi:MAG: right-handed parallel beta-helix repeat-containing protein, partial [Muribaculaceae bacterium]|nr:right-handed parallel beta-helix repeat-containing protein [Muribaculaceae bacterium]
RRISLSREIKEDLRHLDNQLIIDRAIEPDMAYACCVTVENHRYFYYIQNFLNKGVPLFKNILIEIENGIYFSKTDHIFFENVRYPECRISIVGKDDVTIMATSQNLRNGDKIVNDKKVIVNCCRTVVNPEDTYTDGENLIFLSVKDSDYNDGVSFTEGLFEKINPEDKQDLRYRLKSRLLPDMSATECRNLWLWATHSWISSYEKIDSVKDRYIYLTANRETELYQCPLNTDYKSWKVMPRIKVVNYEPSDKDIYVDSDGQMTLPDGYEAIFKSDKGSFIRLDNSEIKSLEVSGIRFVGGNAAIIDVKGVSDYTLIHDCEFTAQQGPAIRFRTDNGIIKNNRFRNSVGNVIQIPNGGYQNHVISNNRFYNCGKRLLNHGCIKVAADSVLISQNTFHNNYISAVSIGVWHGTEQKGTIFTIAEDNVIYNDESILSDYLNNSLLDVSLFYVFTKNDNAIIRRNRIHGLRTLASGNGIYIDDGAYNVSVYDNIVTGIDGKLYNINCRSKISDNAKINAPAFSTGNMIAHNIVDGSIRYEIRMDAESEKYPLSKYGGTIFLSQNGMHFNNKLENIDTSLDKNYKIDETGIHIKITSIDYDSIISDKRKPFNDFFKKWVGISD